MGIHFVWYLETELEIMQHIIFLVKQDNSFYSILLYSNELLKNPDDKGFSPLPSFTALISLLESDTKSNSSSTMFQFQLFFPHIYVTFTP